MVTAIRSCAAVNASLELVS